MELVRQQSAGLTEYPASDSDRCDIIEYDIDLIDSPDTLYQVYEVIPATTTNTTNYPHRDG